MMRQFPTVTVETSAEAEVDGTVIGGIAAGASSLLCCIIISILLLWKHRSADSEPTQIHELNSVVACDSNMSLGNADVQAKLHDAPRSGLGTEPQPQSKHFEVLPSVLPNAIEGEQVSEIGIITSNQRDNFGEETGGPRRKFYWFQTIAGYGCFHF
eukprot:TRINITY_DN48004_c0_g1_i1.p2 TRINITY_DN48004_c0_g1~~TRINITY_DN48004_c0_g1_i1.p2  ORF type:complete len:156 (-),score=26.42 TRINITY_DN48004_c0_g1_i1:303-770(-)